MNFHALFVQIYTPPCSISNPPLRDRVFTSQQRDINDDFSVQEFSRPSHYRSYTDLNMREAISAVVNQGISRRRAAEMHGVPRSTLDDHINGRSLPGCKSGAPTLLTAEEEYVLVEFLLKSASIGYAKTRREVLAMVNRLLLGRGVDKNLTTGWWTRFIKRHPSITLRTPASVSVARIKGSSLEAINNYFDQLTQVFKTHGFEKTPSVVFNMDETGFPLDPKPPKSVFARGSKNPSTISSGRKNQITVVGCVSASGQVLPPMVIWDRKKLNEQLPIGEVPSSIYGLSNKGWMDADLFNKWFKRHFLRYAPSTRPIILIIDGHSSHFCTETIRIASEQGVIVFTLPPNTTHHTQPLDKSIFGPLKQSWKHICHDYLVSHPGKIISRYNFSALFARAWLSTMTPNNCIAGFRTTGIIPLDRDVIIGRLSCEEKPSEIFDSAGLKRLAMYTPAKCILGKSIDEDSYTSDECILDHSHGEQQNEMVNISSCESPTITPIPATPPLKLTRVLTSAQNLAQLEEKERLKQLKLSKKG